MTPSLSRSVRLRALAAAVVLPPLLSIMSLQRLAGALGQRSALAAGTPFDDGELAAWVDSLLYRLPGLWRRTCLKRAAILYHLLRGAGRTVELRIGVRRDGLGKLAAHAWLTRARVPYLEPEPDVPGRHTVIAIFPDPPALA